MKLVKSLVMIVEGFLVGLVSMPATYLIISSVLMSFCPFHPILVPLQFSWVVVSLTKTLYYYLRGTLGSLAIVANISLHVQRWFFENSVFNYTLIPWKEYYKILAST